MKLLYGVQGTGQGHISRTRAISRELARTGVQVTWLFSGRERAALFGMEQFGDFLHRRGLSFTSRDGRLSISATLRAARPLELLRDIRELDLDAYDLIVTDYEPVTAWAGRLANRRVIGIGHQYAFGGSTPMTGDDWCSRMVLRHFAPVTTPVGLHWFPYADHILPPILDLPPYRATAGEYVVVYLPFENQRAVTDWLRRFPRQRFLQFAPTLGHGVEGNVETHPTDAVEFKRQLAASHGVICNSGFELISECLFWGKPVLTKPLLGQVEQLSNALALDELGYARVMHRLCEATLEHWLARPGRCSPQVYPNVAAAIADWLAGGCLESPEQLGRELWSGNGRPLAVRPPAPGGAAPRPAMPVPRPVP